jgi:RNA polymerase primary sigma factor
MGTRENDVLSDYLQSLYGIEPLPLEEEHRLASLIAMGDEKAVEKLVTHNLRFVVYVVRQMTAWHHGTMPVEDMIGMGNEALFQAARRWTTPTNEARFATFAKPFIEMGVRRDLDNTVNLIRLPVNIMEQIKKLNYNTGVLAKILNREPTNGELAQIMQVSKAQINELQNLIEREPISIHNLKQEKKMEESNDD